MTITKYDARSHMTVLTVLVFGPESVSYERSRRETAAKLHHFCGARCFCQNTPKSEFKDIYNIQFFQDTYSQNGFFPYAFQSPDPAARPSARPDTQSISSDTQNISPDTQNISPDTQNISPDTQNISSGTQNISLDTQNISPDTQNKSPDHFIIVS